MGSSPAFVSFVRRVFLRMTAVGWAFCCRCFCISEGVSPYHYGYRLYFWLSSLYMMLALVIRASNIFSYCVIVEMMKAMRYILSNDCPAWLIHPLNTCIHAAFLFK